MIEPKINKAIYEALGNSIGCPRCSDPECTYNRGPDYCNDLNAMHEAESILDEDCRNGFRLELLNVTDSKYFGDFKHIHATARERAEAFLRALGLWKTDHSGKRTEMEVQK